MMSEKYVFQTAFNGFKCGVLLFIALAIAVVVAVVEKSIFVKLHFQWFLPAVAAVVRWLFVVAFDVGAAAV